MLGLENDRCEHRKSDIGKIGRHPGHRTSDCYMAPIPMFGGWSHSAAGRVNAACLPMLGSLFNPRPGEACVLGAACV